jgi:hypothetical protein
MTRGLRHAIRKSLKRKQNVAEKAAGKSGVQR